MGRNLLRAIGSMLLVSTIGPTVMVGKALHGLLTPKPSRPGAMTRCECGGLRAHRLPEGRWVCDGELHGHCQPLRR